MKSEQCILPSVIESDPLNLHSIRSIVGGGGHSLILSENGRVYACGSNTKGQLGFNINGEQSVLKEIQSLALYHIIQISCGWDSSFAVTKDGELLVWGSNMYGQLGMPKSKVRKDSG